MDPMEIKKRRFWNVIGWLVGVCGLIGLLVTPIVLKPEGFTIMVMLAFAVAVVTGILSVTYSYTGKIKFGKAAAVIVGVLAIVLVIVYFAMALSGMTIPPNNNSGTPAPTASESPAPAASESPAPAVSESPAPAASATTEDAQKQALIDQVKVYKDGEQIKVFVWNGKFFFYDETGTTNTAIYKVEIPEGINIIVDSYDLNGKSKGNLVAYDKSETLTLHNGAIGLCFAEDGYQVFTDRYIVLATNHWAKNTVTPLPAWNWTAPKIDD